MTTNPVPTTAAEDLVRLAASIFDQPTSGEIDELLALLSHQPHDVARSNIVDGLLDMKALLIELETAGVDAA